MKLKTIIEAARKLAARRRLGDPVIAAWERRAKRAALIAGPAAAAGASYKAGKRQGQPQTFIVRAPKGRGPAYAHEAQLLARDLGRGPVQVGPRGGRFYLAKSGAKIYLLK